MQTDEERPTHTASSTRFNLNAPGLKVLTYVVAAALLIVAFMFSLLVFAILVIAGLLAWGYLWWKTRELRRQMRERPPGGRVIEGEATREDVSYDKIDRYSQSSDECNDRRFR
ncbi:MAG TPA: hypothetical protein VLV32_11095 [Burkholderiales bacterium]|nr:hypothetical protein [Burkholderiales bacterium]